MILSVDKNQLANYFPYPPWKVVETRGTREGLILKFRTFYLKIYDSKEENSYTVEMYRYGWNQPFQIDKVDSNKFREYAAQFC